MFESKTLRIGRIKFIGILLCAGALVLASRLYYIQGLQGDMYLKQADRQYSKRSDSLFERGSIFWTARDGRLVSAATLSAGYTVALEPSKIAHPEDVVNGLSGILEFDEEDLLDTLSKTSDPYEEIGKRISEKDYERIRNLPFSGVNGYKEKWRSYPGGTLGANVLGFTGFADDGVTVSGRYGLERYYDDVLSRTSPDLYVNFFAEIFSDISGALFEDKEEGDIITTIEPSVQKELEQKIRSIVKAWKSDLTGGIIMDPYTGEIYAMAVDPTFDPNDFSTETDPSVFDNPLVSSVYEMGSIIKPLTMAAGIDAEVITPKSTYNDQGFVIVNGAKVSNFDGRGRGTIDMQQVLNESLNTGMVFVAQKLGNQKLTEYFLSLGFGEETGIDLPGEIHGLVSNLKSPRDIEHVTASFGQGIALTPISTVRALSALGNGGYLPNPHLVKKVKYVSGSEKEITYDRGDKVFKDETSESITRMLVRVVDGALLKGAVKQDHYSIAAKTGTAQMAKESGNGYYDDRYLHSFFGYFPAYKPRFIIFLFTVYPKGAEYASHTLTQPFIDLTKFLINYYEVPPDR
jgi:stage V sporulation protein D (sporulation-specific penicillin-binding protein)